MSEDAATCTSDVQATHALGEERAVIGGYYRSRLDRTETGWRIASSQLSVTWTQGDQQLFARAAERHRQSPDAG